MRAGMMIGLAALALAVAGCDEDKDPEDVPIDMPTVEAEDEQSPPDTSASEAQTDAGGDAATPASPSTATPKVTRPTGASIDACCAALRSASAKERSKSSKAKRIKQAAGLCSSIAPLVRSGKTTRTTALRQVRAFSGSATPPACK